MIFRERHTGEIRSNSVETGGYIVTRLRRDEMGVEVVVEGELSVAVDCFFWGGGVFEMWDDNERWNDDITRICPRLSRTYHLKTTSKPLLPLTARM